MTSPTSSSNLISNADLEKADVYTAEASTEEQKPPSSPLYVVFQLAVASFCGICFGFAIYRSGVERASILRGQFLFTNFVMLKIFLSATATSTFLLTILKHFFPGSEQVQCTQNAQEFEWGYAAVATGAFLLGVGMAVAGACPGTVWVQLGAGCLKSLYTIVGGLTAALVSGIIFDHWKAFRTMAPLSTKYFLHQQLGLPQWAVGAALTLAMAAFVLLLQLLFPEPLPYPLTFAAPRWSPILCGALLGCLQLPLTFVLRKNLGSSSSYVTIVAALLWPVRRFFYFNALRRGISNWWQVTFVVSAAVGSALARAVSAAPAYTGADISTAQALIGGFLVVFGARTAGGCTSGHGISGAAHLNTRSFVAIASMFAGAIAAAFALF